jgi:hypothetical protein
MPFMLFNLKNLADKEPINIKQLVNYSREIIIGAEELESDRTFAAFGELFKHIELPARTKNVVSTQDRILYKLFNRALELHKQLDKIQILESGLGMIILKYSQAEELSDYRFNLFSDMAFQNIWEQLHELKRIFQYRHLNILLQIEKEADQLRINTAKENLLKFKEEQNNKLLQEQLANKESSEKITRASKGSGKIY